VYCMYVGEEVQIQEYEENLERKRRTSSNMTSNFGGESDKKPEKGGALLPTNSFSILIWWLPIKKTSCLPYKII
jgi:hypothetical protein